MKILGLGRTERDGVVDPTTGQVFLERQPGESNESFEARMAASVHEPRVVRETTVVREPPVVTERVQRTAYDEGRRDQHRAEAQRPKRRGFGLVGLAIVIVAALGVLWIALAAREGSFAAGGAVVDQKLASATEPARTAINEAADRTGAAVQNAGQKLEAQGESLRERAR